MYNTTQLTDSDFAVLEYAFYCSGVYTIYLPERHAVYVGRANRPVWERIQDHFNRPRSIFDDVFQNTENFELASLRCDPCALIEGTSILKAEQWCKTHDAKLLNVAIPKYEKLTDKQRKAHCAENKDRFIPEGDETPIKIQGGKP